MMVCLQALKDCCMNPLTDLSVSSVVTQLGEGALLSSVDICSKQLHLKRKIKFGEKKLWK